MTQFNCFDLGTASLLINFTMTTANQNTGKVWEFLNDV